MVNIKVVALGLPETPLVPETLQYARGEGERGKPRALYFGPAIGWQQAPVCLRADLAQPTAGPLIVEDYDSTCVVPPDPGRADIRQPRLRCDRTCAGAIELT